MEWLKGFLSLDVDVSYLEVNQCEVKGNELLDDEISVFHGSHKCHNSTTECFYRPSLNGVSWTRGRYQCVCRNGFYSKHHRGIFNGTLVEGECNTVILQMNFHQRQRS
ncbi:hypothetical protein JTB14_019927 [Gonioctena quinquepunctata]|nr:hypothetical protein JTB14_019927 [Gonioctena quinquepunctata]